MDAISHDHPIMEAQNPDYRVTRIDNVIPFKSHVEMIGACAGRVYFREQNIVTAVTSSRDAMETLRDQLTAALNEQEDAA